MEEENLACFGYHGAGPPKPDRAGQIILFRATTSMFFSMTEL